MKNFEIFFDDLTEKAQKELLKHFETSVDEENWDNISIATVYKEEGE